MKIKTNNISVDMPDELLRNNAIVNNIISIIDKIIKSEMIYSKGSEQIIDKSLKNLEIGAKKHNVCNNHLQNAKNKNDIKDSERNYVTDTIDRKRLPNTNNRNNKCITNTVNWNTLKKNMKVEKPKGFNYFRCPICGQSIVISIDGKNFIKDIHEDNIYPVKINEETKLKTQEDYENLLETSKKNIPVLISNSKDVSGICLKCGKENTLHDFVEAYEHSEMYFENDKICPLCGGEMCAIVDTNIKSGDVEHDKDNKVYKCENCNYKEC